MDDSWKGRIEKLEERCAKLEGRQYELAVKTATLALQLSERAPPVPPATAYSRAATEHYRLMQKTAIEIGDLFGVTRKELAGIRKRLSKPPPPPPSED